MLERGRLPDVSDKASLRNAMVGARAGQAGGGRARVCM